MVTETGKIDVTVQTAGGEPLAGAEVVVIWPRNTRLETSDADGRAVIGGLPAGGPYTVCAARLEPVETATEAGVQVCANEIAELTLTPGPKRPARPARFEIGDWVKITVGPFDGAAGMVIELDVKEFRQISVLATLYPAYRAACVHPAEALRYE